MQSTGTGSSGLSVAKVIGGLVVISVIGVVCVVAPQIGTSPLMPAPLFPLLRTAVEKLTWVPISLLAALGLVAGMVTRLPRVGIGLASVALLPVAAIAEIFADQTSHNLIPLEIMMYLMMSVPVVAMAFVGRAVRGRIERRAVASPA